MNTRSFRAFVVSLAFLMAVPFVSAMTDDQVVDYVKAGMAQGKSQQAIGRELLAKGVTEAQIRRVQAAQSGKSSSNESRQDYSVRRNRSEKNDRQNISNASQNKDGRGSNAVRNSSMNNGAGGDQYFTTDFEEIIIDEQDFKFDGQTRRDPNTNEKVVFGQNIFQSRNLTFEPNENLATPDDYKLGPGDEVVINIWGNNEDHIRQTISPEGSIFVSQIGPIYLNGLSINKANQIVKELFASKYADVAGDGSDISLTLGNLRTIQVDIMGEVVTPGTYRVSPFSTLFHALYNAGGTTESGSLRSIEVMRNGRKVATSDIYDYLFNGKRSNDIRLQEGDVIVVPAYDRLVEAGGEVKRPGIYELKRGETLKDLLKYSGGMKATAYSDRITVDRVTNGSKTVAVVESADFANTRLDDGDVVNVGGAINQYDNRVEVRGAVFRPGYYAINDEVKTLRDLIKIANGLKEDAFLNRAQLFREMENKDIRVLPINLEKVVNGTAPDIKLRKNDILVVASREDIDPLGNIIINGEIKFPGAYEFAHNLTIEDVIMQAGGLNGGASYATVDISRRIDDPNATLIGNELSQNFKLTIKDGLVVDGDTGFVLQPNDIIDVRRSPNYTPQRRVVIEGEVPFEGAYSLTKRNERLSDLVKRAGGVSEFAYLRGANLTRKMSEAEIAARDEVLRLAASSSGNDSIAANKVLLADTYSVGIELDKALANPGGPEDIVIKDGDVIVVPEMVNTVKISGDVLYPNSVVYTPGKKLKYYVEQAGGFGNTANKGRAFVVYMNGRVAQGKNAAIEPGCHIIVPSKQKGKGLSVAEWLAIGTTAASLGTMGATISTLIK